MKDKIYTVGELIDALSEFPRDQHVRFHVPAGEYHDPFGHLAWSNVHEWGLVGGELWSDGLSHAVVQIPICRLEDCSMLPDIDDEWVRKDGF